jgi:hypothetical protein
MPPRPPGPETAPVRPRADQAPIALDAECVSFARYLTRQTPTPYVLDKYRDAHGLQSHLNAAWASRFDRALIAVARAHGAGTWLVDAYTAVFRKSALVRRKWVLLVAILESTAPTAAIFEGPDSEHRAALVMRLAARGAAFAIGLALSAVVFLPLQVLLGLAPGGGPGDRA